MSYSVLEQFIDNNNSYGNKYNITINFSKYKTLYNYQLDALINVYKLLKLYYKDFSADKQEFFEAIYKDKVREYLDINIKEKWIKQYLNLEDNKIHFSELVNRASFWMATGSGKTLVIVKLIELLKQLMDNG
ncbi:MAG: DEAD/DEAH box helicase family protein, partial [Candidatus Micrarchaeia archaeon]